MPLPELYVWQRHFANWPIGWREDQRVFWLLSSFSDKVKVTNFPTLRIIHENHLKETILKGMTYDENGNPVPGPQINPVQL